MDSGPTIFVDETAGDSVPFSHSALSGSRGGKTELWEFCKVTVFVDVAKGVVTGGATWPFNFAFTQFGEGIAGSARRSKLSTDEILWTLFVAVALGEAMTPGQDTGDSNCFPLLPSGGGTVHGFMEAIPSTAFFHAGLRVVTGGATDTFNSGFDDEESFTD